MFGSSIRTHLPLQRRATLDGVDMDDQPMGQVGGQSRGGAGAAAAVWACRGHWHSLCIALTVAVIRLLSFLSCHH